MSGKKIVFEFVNKGEGKFGTVNGQTLTDNDFLLIEDTRKINHNLDTKLKQGGDMVNSEFYHVSKTHYDWLVENIESINTEFTSSKYRLQNGYYCATKIGKAISSNLEPNNSQVYYIPFPHILLSKNDVLCKGIRVLLTSPIENSQVRFGIFKKTNGLNLELVQDLGVMGTGSAETTIREILANCILEKGNMYFIVMKRDDGAGGAVVFQGHWDAGNSFVPHNNLTWNENTGSALVKTGIALGGFALTDTLPVVGNHLFSTPIVYLDLEDTNSLP